jgi:hypothetical protein
LFSFKKFLLDYDGKRYECQPKKPGDDAAVGFILEPPMPDTTFRMVI